jgi:hypothetical protein
MQHEVVQLLALVDRKRIYKCRMFRPAGPPRQATTMQPRTSRRAVLAATALASMALSSLAAAPILQVPAPQLAATSHLAISTSRQSHVGLPAAVTIDVSNVDDPQAVVAAGFDDGDGAVVVALTRDTGGGIDQYQLVRVHTAGGATPIGRVIPPMVNACATICELPADDNTVSVRTDGPFSLTLDLEGPPTAR